MGGRIVVDAVGSAVAIDVSALSAGDAEAVRAVWTDAERAVVAEEVAATVVPSHTGDRAELLSTLSQRVTLAAIETARGRAWMLHAAGLAGTGGGVVVLVGPSGRGKTTAARALGRTLGYVSDETIAIDADGRVRPYRKPLSVITDPAAHKQQWAPSEIGLQALPDAPLRVAAVVLLDRDPGHRGDPTIEVADLGDALGDLVSQTSFLHDQPAPLQFIAALAEATGGIRRVTYAEADTLVPLIAGLAARLPDPIRPLAAAPVAAVEGAERYVRTPVADVLSLEDPDRLAVLTVDDDHRGMLTVLAGIAPAIWRAADGVGLAGLTAAAVAAYGVPDSGDADAAVLVAVGELMDAGLLRSAEPVFARRADVAWVGGGERVVALALSPEDDGRMAQPRALTRSGALLWEWLEEPATLTQLVARAVAIAGAEAAAEVEGQVRGFVDELVASRLVGSSPARALRPW